jgi:UDP-2,4-diacetamido-2,4,6-trideoxy-beta-L-altropyranose hydrolase
VKALVGDAARRRALSEAGRRMVDGRGSARVAAVLACAAGAALRVREAQPRDEGLTLQWANDPAVRAHAFQPAPVTPRQHAAWFRARLDNPRRRLLLVEAPNAIPLGQVRLEQADGGWEIGYLLDPAFRGFGLGAAILRAALGAVPDATPLLARVKSANAASLRVFRRLGFREERVEDSRGPHVLFRRESAAGRGPATIGHADR